jgi:glyoxylase-like metal-dependent hydrolase (beta-lactamase superfamily II)
VSAALDLGGVYLIDTGFGDFGAAGTGGTTGVYLLPLDGGSFALIESGPGSTVPAVLRGIEALGFDPERLDTLLVTHIHLDHAGGAGALAAHGAQVVVHRRGAPHLSAPERLLASARRIYGDSMESVWGEMLSVPPGQITSVEGGETVRLGSRAIEVVASAGHARHHVAYHLDDGSLFTGDAAGIRLPCAATVRPALPPPETDLEACAATLERLAALRPRRLLLTHFSEVTEVDRHLSAVAAANRRWADAVLDGLRRGEDDAALEERIEHLTREALTAEGADSAALARHRDTSSAAMTVMGLSRYWRKLRPEALEGSDAQSGPE